MAKENKDQIGIQSLIDKDGLYREEIYTDLNNGSIKALIPVNDLGVDVVDGSREPVYVAMTTVRDDNGNTLPIHGETNAKHLKGACEEFKSALDKTIHQLVEESIESQKNNKEQE
jgi:uncharacterized protein YdaL